MEWFKSSWAWLESHDVLLRWLFVASAVLLLATPLLVGWMVVRLPTDYFTSKRRQRPAYWERHHVLRPLVLAAKNVAGVVLVAAGLVMLVVPGQGLLTMAVGLMLVDFPGKFRLERWLATRPAVWRSINWLRKRARRTPMDWPE
jgi:hypothetical protein